VLKAFLWKLSLAHDGNGNRPVTDEIRVKQTQYQPNNHLRPAARAQDGSC